MDGQATMLVQTLFAPNDFSSNASGRCCGSSTRCCPPFITARKQRSVPANATSRASIGTFAIRVPTRHGGRKRRGLRGSGGAGAGAATSRLTFKVVDIW
jgi:hypothetical protein